MELSTKSISQSSDMDSCSSSDELNSFDEENQPNFQSDADNDVSNSPQSDFKDLCKLSSKKSENGNGTEQIIPKNKELVVELCDFMICSQENCDLLGYKKYRKKQKLQEIKQNATEQHYYSSKKGVKYEEESDEKDTSDIDDCDKKVNDSDNIPSDHKVSDSEDDLNGKNDSDVEEVSDNKSDSDVEEVSNDKSDSDVEEIKRTLRKRKTKEKVKVKKRSGRLSERKKRMRKNEKMDSDEDDISVHTLASSEVEDSDENDDSDFEEDSDENDDSDIEEANDSGDSDWEIPTKRKRKPAEQKKKLKERKKQKKVKTGKAKTEPLSSFELARQKNVDDKMAFLQSLRMNEIVDDLEETAKSIRKKRVLIKKEKVIGEASRKSKRMENSDMNFSEAAMEKKIYEDAENIVRANAKQEIPRFYPFDEAFCGDTTTSLSKIKKYFGSSESEEVFEINISNRTPIDLNQINPMLGTSCDLPFTLSYIAFHPTVSKTIILAGSSTGHISLWNPDTHQYLFAPHSGPVTRLEAHPDYPHWIISSSYDGTLRLTDLNKECFVEILKNNSPLKSFDFLSPTGYLVSHQNGLISMVDGRMKRNNSGQDLSIVQQWESSKKSVNIIRVHPTKKDVCLSLDSDGFLKVWDLRKHQSPIWQNKNQMYFSSAEFSPVTGNTILGTSKTQISIYDSSKPHRVHRNKLSFRLDNYAENITELNKYLPKRESKTRKTGYGSRKTHFTMAKWIPGSDNTFIVTNNYQNKVLILNINGQKMSCLDTSCTVSHQVVHPSQNMLVIAHNPQYRLETGKFSLIKLYMEKNDSNIDIHLN